MLDPAGAGSVRRIVGRLIGNMPRSRIDKHRDQLLKNTSLEDLQRQLKQATKMEKTLKGGFSKARRGWKQLKEQITAEIERRANQSGANIVRAITS